MRCVLTNFGTTGDLQPFLALATELRRRGHVPLLAFPGCMQERIQQLGFEFAALGPESILVPRELNHILLTDPQASSLYRRAYDLLRPLFDVLPQTIHRLQEICRGADLLISGPAQPAARIVHELTGIIWVSIQFSHFGGTGMPGLRQASADLINPIRQKYGLPAISDPLTHDANSPCLAIYAVSRHLRPRLEHWPPHYQITGFFYLDEDAPFPDEELRTFIQHGEPPVVVSFGSMGESASSGFMDVILQALAIARCRAVVQKAGHGWKSATRRSDCILMVGYVPHQWIFPRAACIVHHGGAGTAAAVFRAGVPSIFVPHGDAYDQTYWAQLAEDYGCSGPALRRDELDAANLGRAILETCRDSQRRRAAVDLSRKIRREEGVHLAVRLIEEMACQRGIDAGTTDDEPVRILGAQARRAAALARKSHC